MRPQIKVERELLSADFTLEWSLPCVHDLVPPQLAVVEELLAATFHCADEETLAVGRHVLL